MPAEMSKPQVDTPDVPLLVRILLLLLLPMFALIIWWSGQHYDTGLLELKPEGAVSLLPQRLGTLQRLGPPRVYTKANLYEYIDGHAEYFISAGFQGLVVGEYGLAGEAQPSLVVNLYDMGRPLYAFGVLMDELAADAEPAEVGDQGFVLGQGVNLIQGRHYLQLSTFGTASPPIEAAQELAGMVAQQAADKEVLDLRFPELGEVVSTYFVKEDYRGLGFLNNVLERTFRSGKGEITAFLINADPDAIKTLVGRLTDFLDGEGIGYRREARGGVPYYLVDDPYEGEWFFVPSGARILGVFSPATPELLELAIPAG